MKIELCNDAKCCKGDIFTSLANIFLVANVNKNDHAHSHHQRSGLTVFSILKHRRSSALCSSLTLSSTMVLLISKFKFRCKEKSQKKMLTLDFVLVRCLTSFYGVAFIAVAFFSDILGLGNQKTSLILFINCTYF